MMKIILYRLLIGIFLILLISCSFESNKQSSEDNVKSNVENNKELQEKQKNMYLDKFNSDKRIILNTESYKLITKEYKKQNYKLTYAKDNLLNNSVFFNQKTDSIHITYYFESKGTCNDLFPYVSEVNDTLLLNCPQIVEGDVEIEGKDTIVSFMGCTLKNNMILKISIPFDETYIGKSIKFKNHTFRLVEE